MVGFPGEGEREFANTKSLLADLPFTYCHVFSFSKRPGTAAARMTNRVRSATAKERSRTLVELARAKRLAFYQQRVGRTVQVLFETRDSDGRWTGLTGNYIRTGLVTDRDLTNRFENVLITGVMDGLAIGTLNAER
jgi:threonylcarbamoyladenosine tRNA methylthiotransferase MtaB